MSSCTSCGHQLGVGRFCTNCGAPVDSSTPDGTPVSTPVTPPPLRRRLAHRHRRAEAVPGRGRPAHPSGRGGAAPAAPLPAVRGRGRGVHAVRPAHHDHLRADRGAGGRRADARRRRAEPAEPEYEPYDYDYDYDEERRSPVLWILAAALVLVLVAAGWWFLVRDDGSDPAADDGGSGQSAQEPGTSSADGVDVAGRASAEAPKTAPPNEDVNGDQVSYDASNMLDGVPDTAWRAPGDATGMKLTFTLREPTELHQVGHDQRLRQDVDRQQGPHLRLVPRQPPHRGRRLGLRRRDQGASAARRRPRACR